MARDAEGSRYPLSLRRRLQEGPRTRPHASPRHPGRTSASPPSHSQPRRRPGGDPRRPPRLPPPPAPAGGSGPAPARAEGARTGDAGAGEGRAAPGRGSDTCGQPGRGPAAALPVDLVREGAALGGRHGAARVPPLPPRAPSPPWSPPPPLPPGSGLPGLGGAGAGGGALPGVRGGSVLPLPAGGARGAPGRLRPSRVWGGETEALKGTGEERRRDRGRGCQTPGDALSAL